MADGRNYVVPDPRNGKNAGARLCWGEGLMPRLEGGDSMAFEVKDDHCRRAVFRFYTLLIVSNSFLHGRQLRLQLRLAVVGELILTSITDYPNFGITDFHSKLNGPASNPTRKRAIRIGQNLSLYCAPKCRREEVVQQNSENS